MYENLEYVQNILSEGSMNASAANLENKNNCSC